MPMAVKWKQVDEDFKSNWQQNNQIHFNHPADPNDNLEWARYTHRLQNIREAIFKDLSDLGFESKIINLAVEGKVSVAKHQAYIIQSQWIVENSDILVAIIEEDRKVKEPVGWQDGGTAVTLNQWVAGGKLEKSTIEINPAAT